MFSGVGSGPFVPSSRTLASLVSCVMPAGMVLSTSTVTARVTLAPAARLPTSRVRASPNRPRRRLALTKVVYVRQDVGDDDAGGVLGADVGDRQARRSPSVPARRWSGRPRLGEDEVRARRLRASMSLAELLAGSESPPLSPSSWTEGRVD